MVSHSIAKQGVIFGESANSASERVAQSIIRLRENPYNRVIQRHIYMVGDHELTPVQVGILETVVNIPGLRMVALAQNLGVDASTVSRTVMPLIDLGLIERGFDARDKRVTILHPTEEGLRQAHLLAQSRGRVMLAVQSHMAPERLDIFADLLSEYAIGLNAEGARLAEAEKHGGGRIPEPQCEQQTA